MAEQSTKELVIELSLENSKLKASLSDAEKSMNKTKTSMGGAISSIKMGWLAIAAAITGGIIAIKNMVKETIEAERTQNKLITAMKNQGIFSNKLLKDYNDQAKALQNLTLFEADQITTLQAQLTQFGLSGKALKDVTKATLDLAQSQGMDLQTAGTLVGKTINSNVNALGRYGITTITAKNATDRATQAVEGLNRVFGGQAEGATKTFEGRLIQLSNTGKDFQESLGKGIIIGIDPLLKRLQQFTGSEKGLKILGNTAKVIASIFVVLGGVVGQVVQNVINYGRLIGNTFTAIGSGFKKAIDGDFKGAGEDLKKGFENVKLTVIDTAVSFVNTGKDIAKGLEEVWSNTEKTISESQKKITVTTEENAEDVKNRLLKKQEEADALIKQSREKNEEERIQNAINTIDELVKIEGIGDERIKALSLARLEFEKQLSAQRIQQTLDNVSTIQQGLSSIYTQYQTNRSIEEDNARQSEYDALQTQLNDKILTEEEYNNKKSELDKKNAKEDAEIKRKQAIATKTFSIIDLIIQTAKAVAQYGFITPMAIASGVLGAAQIAMVSAQPIPEVPKFAGGGMISGLNSSFSGEDGMIGARNGEAVLNQTATAMLGEDAINALNKGRSVNPTVTININGGDTQNIVKTLNTYFKQYGTSARGVAV